MMSETLDTKQELSRFWSSLDKIFFELTPHHKKIIQRLIRASKNHETQEVMPVYSSYHQYRTIKSLLKHYFKPNSRKKIHTLNNQNVKKYLFIRDRLPHTDLDTTLSKIRDNIRNTSNLDKTQQLKRLKTEESQLLQLISKTDMDEEQDEILSMLQQLEGDRDTVSQFNTHLLMDLESKLTSFDQEFHTLSQNNNSFVIQACKPLTREIEEELYFIKKLIISLQKKQVAESISKYQVQQYGPFLANQVMTWFDIHLAPDPQQLELETFTNLNQLRRDVKIEKIEKFSFRSRSDTVSDQSNIFCHFCKQMVSHDSILRCTYNSQTKGMPEYNDDLTLSTRVMIDDITRDQFIKDYNQTHYLIAQDGSLNCRRGFCHHCMKYEFDWKEKDEPNWICPLCQGVCTCQRCQRSENIFKLKRMYTEIGGDLTELCSQLSFGSLISTHHTVLLHLAKLIKEREQLKYLLIKQVQEVFEHVLRTDQWISEQLQGLCVQ